MELTDEDMKILNLTEFIYNAYIKAEYRKSGQKVLHDYGVKNLAQDVSLAVVQALKDGEFNFYDKKTRPEHTYSVEHILYNGKYTNTNWNINW